MITKFANKKIFLIGFFTLILICGFGFANKTFATGLPSKWFGSYGTQTSASAVRYFPPSGAVTPQSTEVNAYQLTPSSGTVQKLRVQLDAAPGTGKSYAITFRSELSNTALTCTISDSATSCSDIIHTASITAGNRLSVSVTPTGTPAAARVSFILEFVPTTSGETVLMGGNAGAYANTTNYSSFVGNSSPSATEINLRVIIPANGTLKNFYSYLSATPGTSNSRTFTVRKNAVDTTLITTFNASDSGVLSDTTHTVTVAAGDLITISHVPVGTPTAGQGAFGVVFVPDTAGNFIIPITNTTPSTSAVNYLGLSGANTISATENQTQTLGSSDYTLTAVYVKLGSVAGSGKSWTTGLRENAVDASNTFGVTVSGTSATTGSLTGQSFTPLDGALYDTIITPSGTPSADRVFVSYLGHVAADVTPPTVNTYNPANNATGVSINSNLVLTFSENVAKGTGNILIKNTIGDATVQTIDVTSGSVVVSGNTVTITPSALSYSTSYYVTMASGVLTDTSLNPYAGISDKTIWTFTTAAPDTTPPVAGNSGAISTASVAGHSLTLNWTKATDNVSAQANLQYEVIQSTSNNIDTVTNAESNGTIIHAFSADINTFNVTGLNPSTTYYFNVVVKDESGNKTAYTTQSQATTISNYNVKGDGSGDFTTIQACSNAAIAGDTCTVYAGTYSETVTASASGTIGYPIVFQIHTGDTVLVNAFVVSGKNYVTIQGFSIGNHSVTGLRGVQLIGASHIIINNNNINYTGGKGIGFNQSPWSTANNSNYCTISNNTISWTGYNESTGDYGIDIYGDHNLIDSNDISHVGDYTHVHGSYNILRNNLFHDAYSTDFSPNTAVTVNVINGSTAVSGSTFSLGWTPLQYAITINGYAYTISSVTDASNLVLATPYTGSTGSYSAVVAATNHIDGMQTDGINGTPLTHLLMEGNIMSTTTEANTHFSLLTDVLSPTDNPTDVIARGNTYNTGGYFIIVNGIPNVKIYNNTVANMALPQQYVSSWGAATIAATGGAWLNNLLYNAVLNGWRDITSSGATPVAGNTLVYNSGYSGSWKSDTTAELNIILNQDPLFVNSTSNFQLQSASPARDAGTYLTAVANSDTGSGTSLIVNDAGFFQDGYGIVNADWIAIGTVGNIVQISSIDYSTNTITLVNGITRSVGDHVWLYKNSNGTRVLYGTAPDIGAYESLPYTVGGTISGLSGTVVLQNNNGDNLSVSANGSFTFATSLNNSASYAVTVLTQPSGQTCTVSSGSGTVSSANVTSVTVTCVNTTKAISTFNFAGLTPTVTGTIDNTAHTVVLTVPFGTDVTALVPTITHTGASISPLSGVAGNFTTPQTYRVTAADSSHQDYVVTVTVSPNTAKAITGFTISGQTGNTTIDETSHTISLTVPYGTILTALVPTITITGSSVSPVSGLAQDFTTPTTYTVTAANASTQNYVVTVTVGSAPVVTGGGPLISGGNGAPVGLMGGHRQDITNLLASTIPVTSTTTIISGCNKGTNGFSITTGQSCLGNTGGTTTSTPTLPKYNFTRNLSLHATGKDVKALQQFLNANGFVISKTGAGSPGKETTLFGTLTYKALVKFQKSLGWSGTGFFGPMTREYIAKH